MTSEMVTCPWCGWEGDPVRDAVARCHLIYGPATCPETKEERHEAHHRTDP
ncbi:MAG: hypothetical protein M0Z46_20030 [Actinomycetota bacterium]|nr:hypothetical protein [Actinomycetota bacterium]